MGIVADVGLSAAVEVARRVLRTEIEALEYLANHIPKDFSDAVSTMLACQGRVVVSGIGKSGHIGRKIAATLASTGTPSYFVHCAEASHGDLGMITSQDVCILISNSGESSELRDVVYHTQRFSIPMIAITSNPSSTLGKASTFCLTLPKLAEACSIGMAPTTSTTLTLALGDALAVALMERRGFVAQDFSVFHPGGKLGAQMRQVSELMHDHDRMPILAHDASMQEAILTMTSKGFGIAILVRDGKLFGVISDGDLRRNMQFLMQASPEKIANTNPVTVRSETLVAEALAILDKRKISALVVVDDTNRPIGVLHMHDLLRAGAI